MTRTLSSVQTQKNLVVTTTTDLGVLLGFVLGLTVSAPLYFVVALRIPRLLESVPPAVAGIIAFLPLVLTCSAGSYFLNRRRFVFRPNERVVEVRSDWCLLQGKIEVVPFSLIKLIELRWNYEGPPSLEMFTGDGGRWTLKRRASMRRLRLFAEEIASILVKKTADGMRWS